MTETASAARLKTCLWCGAVERQGVCPSVKAIEYFENGNIKRVEFKTAADWPRLNDWTFGIGSGPMVSDKT